MTAEEYRCGNVTALLALPVHHAIKFQFERIGICRRLALYCRRCLSAWEESVLIGALVAVAFGSQPVRADDCVIVRATADARNQTVSTERSKRRLQHYIGRKLNSFTAKSISTVTTHCIRNACESSAIVCRH